MQSHALYLCMLKILRLFLLPIFCIVLVFSCVLIIFLFEYLKICSFEMIISWFLILDEIILILILLSNVLFSLLIDFELFVQPIIVLNLIFSLLFSQIFNLTLWLKPQVLKKLKCAIGFWLIVMFANAEARWVFALFFSIRNFRNTNLFVLWKKDAFALILGFLIRIILWN